MNMVEFGYLLAVGLILMVIAVHGARLFKMRRQPSPDSVAAE